MRYLKLIIFILMLVCSLAWCYTESAKNDGAVVPRTNNTFPFQGYFTDSQGRAYFGTVMMGFKFCSDEGGKDVVYGNTADESMVRSVKVYNGFYATKVSLPKNAFAKLAYYDNIWVKVYVDKSAGLVDNMAWGKDYLGSSTRLDDDNDNYLLKPHVQLTAAPYALGVRGLAYQSGSSPGKGVLKVGGEYRGKPSSAASNGKDNLVISGNVKVAVSLDSAENTKLVISDKLKGVSGTTIIINGELSAPDGVYGAVWN
ncbi:MAG: hypothetical protein LBD99_00095 [Candidatus Margulisbacteria bacterium]|jgi:hypothetical protein|nr:hypothetical protein [Candidatus Margulisiibacteriota bacterium]